MENTEITQTHTPPDLEPIFILSTTEKYGCSDQCSEQLPPLSENNKIITFSISSHPNSKSKNKPPFLTTTITTTQQLSEQNLFGKKQIKEKEKTKRVVVEKEIWKTILPVLSYEYQLEIIYSIYLFWFGEDTSLNIEKENIIIENKETIVSYAHQQLQQKRNGYKYQDITKKIYDEKQFISLAQVVYLLHHSKLKCYYCQCVVNILYEYVRDNKQWSLERINNHFGHNWGNVEIACLECNLKRKTMYYERYVATQQIKNIVKIGDDGEATSPNV